MRLDPPDCASPNDIFFEWRRSRQIKFRPIHNAFLLFYRPSLSLSGFGPKGFRLYSGGGGADKFEGHPRLVHLGGGVFSIHRNPKLHNTDNDLPTHAPKLRFLKKICLWITKAKFLPLSAKLAPPLGSPTRHRGSAPSSLPPTKRPQMAKPPRCPSRFSN